MCRAHAYTFCRGPGQAGWGPARRPATDAASRGVRPAPAEDGHQESRRVRGGTEGRWLGECVLCQEPSSTALHFPSSDSVLLEAILTTLFLVFSRVPQAALPLSWEVFQELFVFLSMLLDSKMAGEAGYGPPAEERALRALQVLRTLLLCVDER